jgi:hypothetical protein
MSMIAKCPKDASHKRFRTVATVQEMWIVDDHGDFIEVVQGSEQVVFAPTAGNLWVCAECGAPAEVSGI